MMGVREDIAAQVAELEHEVDAPTGALGYGTDLACVTDVTPDLEEVDPFSVRAIGEALIRRFTTPRGTLPDDPDYGLDLRSYCNRGVTATQLRELASQLRGEAGKDDRVDDAAITVTAEGSSLTVAARITPADPDLEPFDLTFAVTSADVLAVTIT